MDQYIVHLRLMSNEIYYIRRQNTTWTIRTKRQAATQDISLALYNSTQRTA